MQFTEEASKPVTRKVNEYRDPVKAIAGTQKVISFVLDGNKLSPDEIAAQYRQARTLLTEAGNEQNPAVTIRLRDETLDDGKSLKVYFWATSKIRHEDRKPRAKKAAPVKK